MALKQITTVGLRKEHYKAEALIIYCVDDRGKKALEEFIRVRGYKHPDVIRVPGGAFAIIAKPGPASEEVTILGYISSLLMLHQAERIIITTHVDCGACGGSSAFSSREQECQSHERWLMRDKKLLEEEFPGVPIEAYFVDYDGFWQVV